MSIHLIPTLAEAIEKYYEAADYLELCQLFDVAVEFNEGQIAFMRTARRLITEIEHSNNRRLLEALIPSLLSKSRNGIANTKWAAQEYHSAMEIRILDLQSLLERDKIPEQITVEEQKPFTAKSEVREFLENASTPITIVDNYIGVGTLDCLRDVQHQICLLTGSHKQNIEKSFDNAFSEFKAEGRNIKIKCHSKLHDRYILFNDRCWMVGSSLKDAGKKTFNVIECVDIKEAIVKEINRKWEEAQEYST